MSGGTYDYIYFKIEQFAEDIELGDCGKRLAFKEALILAAKAAKAIEWVDSGDWGDGDDIEAIDEFLSFLNPSNKEKIDSLILGKIKKLMKQERL